MRFNLDYTPENPGFHITHKDPVFLIGSCFSNNIGKYLSDHQFNISSNPNGILFNPSSISLCFQNILDQKKHNGNFTLQRDAEFYSYLHHSCFHDTSAMALNENISRKNREQYDFLRKSSFVIITFGSAFYYYHKSLKTVVANCHKQSGQLFEKRLLSVDEIFSDYTGLIENLRKLNSNLKIIFTVSPVKYLKDGIIENNLSKSTLILAVHRLVKSSENCFYFPAFELVNDDLRDYRFYKEDLAHPNEQAIQYIWDKFSDCYFNPGTKKLNLLISELNSAKNHRKMLENKEESGKLDAFILKKKDEIQSLFSAAENQKKS